jgi:sterol desaturase/sphingolipid hydroxylase (fatty acid hydroxylase superfamily)
MTLDRTAVVTGAVVYLVAGLFAWYVTEDYWWQRALMVLLWFPLFVYNLVLDFLDWWSRQGYHYQDDD